MAAFEGMGRLLIFMGLLLALFGVLVTFWAKLPFLGKLPGDIVVAKGNFRFFFPLVTSLVLSAIITLVLNIVLRATR